MDFKIGDIVKSEGTITDTGVVSVQVAYENGSIRWLHTSEVELVSRPEPTYTVELTGTQIEILREGVYSSSDDPDEAAAAKALDVVLSQIDPF